MEHHDLPQTWLLDAGWLVLLRRLTLADRCRAPCYCKTGFKSVFKTVCWTGEDPRTLPLSYRVTGEVPLFRACLLKWLAPPAFCLQNEHQVRSSSTSGTCLERGQSSVAAGSVRDDGPIRLATASRCVQVRDKSSVQFPCKTQGPCVSV